MTIAPRHGAKHLAAELAVEISIENCNRAQHHDDRRIYSTWEHPDTLGDFGSDDDRQVTPRPATRGLVLNIVFKIGEGSMIDRVKLLS